YYFGMYKRAVIALNVECDGQHLINWAHIHFVAMGPRFLSTRLVTQSYFHYGEMYHLYCLEEEAFWLILIFIIQNMICIQQITGTKFLIDLLLLDKNGDLS
ncbi:hypothetical protein ACJX0J_016843, partial [Zea mays]